MSRQEHSEQVNPPAGPAGLKESPSYPTIGFRLGDYVITEVLGHGAMATVFAAKDPTGHEVALKVFQEGPGVSATMLERFRREAEASKKLRRHPHILTVYETGQEGPYHYIVMESVRNSLTLETALESTPLSLKSIVQIVIKIARALQYAHTRHIIHRDVKPTNVLIDEFGEPLLSDFGVAALVDWPSCTITGALTGTPLYMSPEQARTEPVGPSSDVYSLGVVLFEALTGVLPYTTQHAAPIREVLQAVREELPKRPRLYRREISPELEAVVLKALEKNPKDRYIDAESFAIDLERALANRPVSAHHFTYWDRVRHVCRVHERFLTTILLLLLAASGMWFFFRQRLLTVHAENLLGLAWRRNAQYALAQSRSGTEFTPEIPRAWQEIRLARRAMNGGDYPAAVSSFRSAANVSVAVGDQRTAAIARLDQARCETMLNAMAEAEQTYNQILISQESPPGLASLAQLEYLAAALLHGDRQVAFQTLMVRDPPAEGPIRLIMNCLAGDMALADLEQGIESMPYRLRNDAYFALSVRAYLNGNVEQYTTFLRSALRSSVPSFEWPGPYARKLLSEALR